MMATGDDFEEFNEVFRQSLDTLQGEASPNLEEEFTALNLRALHQTWTNQESLSGFLTIDESTFLARFLFEHVIAHDRQGELGYFRESAQAFAADIQQQLQQHSLYANGLRFGIEVHPVQEHAGTHRLTYTVRMIFRR